jgi:hypothetical protein
MPSSLRLGCRVSAAVGPLLPQSASGKRRTRQRFKGILIRSEENRRWMVFWDDIGRCSIHPGVILRFEESQTQSTDPLGGLNVANIIDTLNVGDQQGIDVFSRMGSVVAPTPPSTATVTPTPPSTTTVTPCPPSTATLTTASPAIAAETLAPPSTVAANSIVNLAPEALNPTVTLVLRAATHAATTVESPPTVEDQDPASLEHTQEEDTFDPMSIVADMLEDDRDGTYLRRFQEYLEKKRLMTGDQVPVNNRSQEVIWTILDDVTPEQVPVSTEHEKVGIRGFDFNNQSVKTGGPRKNLCRINFLSLLIHLWPGDWQAQLKQLNVRIGLDNEIKKRNSRPGFRNRSVKQISENEFWVWWGVFVSARTYGRKGNMWDRHKPEGEEPKVDYSMHIPEHRFGEIRYYIPFLFADQGCQQDDPWWKFSKGVEEFNTNRKNTVLSSYLKVMDESMSAFRPQTSKTGNLPHLSYIQRKPENLGTELKDTADTKTGMMIFLELQRGKIPMRSLEYSNSLRVTAACTMRMAAYTKRQEDETVATGEERTKDLWLGDSWFTSVESVTAVASILGGRFTGVVKTSHARYPKKFIEETMLDWPAGSHLVLGATVNGVELLAIGYKYNKRKVMCFLSTKSSGHTKPGKSYEAKWKDENGNSRSRLVPRPFVVSEYFNNCNKIDLHNQSRQHDLKLEKMWVTEDGYFRLVTTLIGIGITDCWKGYRFHLKENHRHKKQSLRDFNAILAKDLLENSFTKSLESEQSLTIDVPTTTEALSPLTQEEAATNFLFSVSTLDSQTVASALSSSLATPARSPASSSESLLGKHKLEENEEKVKYQNTLQDGSVRSGKRTRRGKCMRCGKNTKFFCGACPLPNGADKAWCCQDSATKKCNSQHLSLFLGKSTN